VKEKSRAVSCILLNCDFSDPASRNLSVCQYNCQHYTTWLTRFTTVPLASTWVRFLPDWTLCPRNFANNIAGTTYSCVANYEGTNVEISRSLREHVAWIAMLTMRSRQRAG
jgi:hypothetical protein